MVPLSETFEEIMSDTPTGRLANVVFNWLVWAAAFIPYMIFYAPTPSHTKVSLVWTLANQTLNTDGNVQTVGLQNSLSVVQLNWAFTGLFLVNLVLLFAQWAVLTTAEYHEFFAKQEFLSYKPTPEELVQNKRIQEMNSDEYGNKKEFNLLTPTQEEQQEIDAFAIYTGQRDMWFPYLVFANYPLMAVILLNLMGVDTVYAALGVSAAIVVWNIMLMVNELLIDGYELTKKQWLQLPQVQSQFSEDEQQKMTLYVFKNNEGCAYNMVLFIGPSLCYAFVITIFALPIQQLMTMGVNTNLYISFVLFMTLFSGQTFLHILWPLLSTRTDRKTRWTLNTVYHALNLILFTAFFISMIFLLSHEYLL